MASLDALLALLAPADAAAFESKAARAVLGAVLEKHGGDAVAAAAAVTAVLDADREEAAEKEAFGPENLAPAEFGFLPVRGTSLTRTPLEEAYDYIVVGSGSAGSIVANRLSADPSRRVLLLEAGLEDDLEAIHRVGSCGALQRSDLDWQYQTEPEPNACLKFGERRSNWPRGKVMGGSSCLNYMQYVRGNAQNYDSWRDEYGCEGWGFDDVLPLFKRSENNADFGESEYHGAGGELDVAQPVPESATPLRQIFIDAGDQAGFTANDDYNGAEQFGTGGVQLSADQRGVRSNTARAFIHTVADERPNLTVAAACHVTRVLFEGEGPERRAVGVALHRMTAAGASDEIIVRAEREVVLSGGAIGSAHTLLLSGIGPKEELAQHGIECVADLGGHSSCSSCVQRSSMVASDSTSSSAMLARRSPMTVTFSRTRSKCWMDSPYSRCTWAAYA